MPGTSDRLELALPVGSDNFATSELATNLETIDSFPGVFVLTAIGSLPAWGANQTGQYVHETSTGLIWRWNGAALVRDWPKGWLAAGSRTTDGTTSSSAYGTLLTVTPVPVPAGGRKVQISVDWLSAVGKGYLAIYRSTTLLREFRIFSTVDERGGSCVVFDTPSSGNHTYTIQTKADSGQSLTIRATTDGPLTLTAVEV